jgi:hypothetical protein
MGKMCRPDHATGPLTEPFSCLANDAAEPEITLATMPAQRNAVSQNEMIYSCRKFVTANTMVAGRTNKEG